MGILFNIKETKIEKFNTPEELSSWMKKNIHYKEFTKLMSWEEVLKTKTGSCHDQVMFEKHYLQQMGLSPKGLFIIEYDDNNQGGQTHSLIFYINTNKKLIWIENAWHGMEGLHKFNTLKDLKIKLKELHKTKKLGNIDKYPYLEIRSLKSHKPGENLNDFVNNNL